MSKSSKKGLAWIDELGPAKAGRRRNGVLGQVGNEFRSGQFDKGVIAQGAVAVLQVPHRRITPKRRPGEPIGAVGRKLPQGLVGQLALYGLAAQIPPRPRLSVPELHGSKRGALDRLAGSGNHIEPLLAPRTTGEHPQQHSNVGKSFHLTAATRWCSARRSPRQTKSPCAPAPEPVWRP